VWNRIATGAGLGVFASMLIAATAGWMFQLLPTEQVLAHADAARAAMSLWFYSLPGATIAGGLIAYVSRPSP